MGPPCPPVATSSPRRVLTSHVFFPFVGKSLSQGTAHRFWNCGPFMNLSKPAVLQTVFSPVRLAIEHISLKITEYSKAFGQFLALTGPWDPLLQTASPSPLDAVWHESCLPSSLCCSSEIAFLYLSSLCFPFFFWLLCAACRILVPQPGIEPRPTAVKALSPNYWTTREFPPSTFLNSFPFQQFLHPIPIFLLPFVSINSFCCLRWFCCLNGIAFLLHLQYF